MKSRDKINYENAAQEQSPLMEDVVACEQTDSEVKSKKRANVNKLIADIMGGDMFMKDGFVGLFPFFFYIVTAVCTRRVP